MSKWIMLPSGKQVYCDEDGRPLKAVTSEEIVPAWTPTDMKSATLIFWSRTPVVSRRFCACGQELFGRLLAAGSTCCGECVLRTSIARREGTSLAGRHLDQYRNQNPTQPDVEEHAWESTHWSWP